MAHGSAPVTLKDVRSIVAAEPFRLSVPAKAVLTALMILGVAAFFIEMLGGDVRHAWMALHVNFLFWLILSAAASGFTGVFHICNAQWARPVRRLFESALPFFTITPLILVVLSFGAEHLFVWTHKPIPGKEMWLQHWYVFGRDVIALVLLVVVTRKNVHYSLRKDIGAIRGGLTGLPQSELTRWSGKEYDDYVAGWSGDHRSEVKQADDRMGRLSPIVVMLYAAVLTLISWDQIMSVDPYWYSTMFGGFVFMSGVYLAVAWVCCAIWLARDFSPLLRSKIQRSTLHDVGKLLFGFGIFWAYLFWCHYLPIWYGNIPEETGWIITRLRLNPWHDFAWCVLAFSWMVPFLLGLSRDVKQVPVLLFCTALFPITGLWLQSYLLFTPTLYPHEIPLGFTDIAVFLGFLGAFLLTAGKFLERAPLIPFGDLYIPVPAHRGTDLAPAWYSPN